MPTSTPPLRLVLDTNALVANWQWLGRQGGRAACGAAIKADGYGLGAREVSARLANAGCRDFFVATWAEAEALDGLSGGCSLSVLHGVREADMGAALAGFAKPVLNNLEQVARWKAAGGGVCDVMIDTGMNRLGLSPDDARSGTLDGLQIDILMSHLACADEPDNPMNEAQLFLFRGLRGSIPAQRYSLANSAGVCLGQRYAFQLTRPGLALYGGIPRAEARGNIAQVVKIEAEVLQVRSISAGATVGYGATFKAQQPMQLATLNLGYADGYFRCFAGKGMARAGDVACPLVGRISMDLVIADISQTPQVREGDWLSIDYTLSETSEITGLSQYELLTSLGHRYQRHWI
jgi:alanine racemase